MYQQPGGAAGNGGNGNQMAYMGDGQAGYNMIGQGGQMPPGGDPGMPHMVGGMQGDGQG